MAVFGIILPIVFVFLFLFLIWALPSKGEMGEAQVSRRLSMLPEDEYRIFNNVMLPTPKGTTQIDHIIVSEYGVFVIETKYYQGWIFGGEYSEKWTQNLYGTKNEFYNPILQNDGHVKTLRYLLQEFGDVFIYPIVTFTSQATLKVHLDNSCVIYWNELASTVLSFNTRRISQQQVHAICNKITNARLDTSNKEVLERHKYNASVARSIKEDAEKKGKCPRCGGTLILRKSQYGYFYGCSNYPRCRYIRSLK